LDFSPLKNVVWKKAIPYGQSSPVVARARIYLTSSEGDRLFTICLDAKTGNQLLLAAGNPDWSCDPVCNGPALG
jgi:outer membrane protein assembly factor BamB